MSAEHIEEHNEQSPLYGLLAEFETPEALIKAAHSARKAGYRNMEAYTPFPVEGLSEALEQPNSLLPPIVFIGGAIGCAASYFLQYFAAVLSYPWNVGGRPYHSAPQFVPVTFEMTVLGASLAAAFGMIFLNGLPRPYHALFNAPVFARASNDRFFLCIESSDPKFEINETRQHLQDWQALHVFEVEP